MGEDWDTPYSGASSWDEVLHDSLWTAFRPKLLKVKYEASSVLDEKAPLGRLANALLKNASVDLLLFRYRNTIYLLAGFDCSRVVGDGNNDLMKVVEFRKEPLQKPATLMALTNESYIPSLLMNVRAAFWYSYLRFEVDDDWFLDGEEDPANWTQIYEGGPRRRLIDVHRWSRKDEIEKRQLLSFYKDFRAELTELGGSGLATLAKREAFASTNPDLRDVLRKEFERSWVDHKGVRRTSDESVQGLDDLFEALFLMDPVLRFEDSRVTLKVHVRQGIPLSKRLMGLYLYLLGKVVFVGVESLLLAMREEDPLHDTFSEDDELQELFGWLNEGALFSDPLFADPRENSFAHMWITPERIVFNVSSSYFDESFGRARPNPDVIFIENFASWSDVDPNNVDFEKYLQRLKVKQAI
jgi:hypothetical protein